MNAFDSEIFKRNFAALAQRSPAVSQALCQFKARPEHEILPDEGRQLTLLVDGMQLTSHHDRMAAAAFNLQKVDRKLPVHLYGYGLGDELRLLLEESPAPQIVLHIICPVLMLQILCIDDGFAGLMQDNVSVVLEDGETKLQANRAANLTELRLEEDFGNALKLRLISELERGYAAKLFERTVGARIDRAIAANGEKLKNERFLRLAELPTHGHIVVAASGPSLEREFASLERARAEGAYVIAVDTALIYLEKRGFVPDALVSLDDLASKMAGRVFLKTAESYAHTLLVYAPSSDPKLWEGYMGARRCLVTARALKVLSWLKPEAGDQLYSSGSVTLTAVSLALGMHAQKISLIGTDFAYAGDTLHAGVSGKDFLTSGGADVKILCNDGAMRKTQRNFAIYQEDLENLIAANPQTEFANLSKLGARIKGAPYKQG